MSLTIEQFAKAFADIGDYARTLWLKTIDGPHHEIHEGDSYTLSQFTALNDLDDDTPLTYRFITPQSSAKRMHLIIFADVSTSAVLELFEDNERIDQYNVAGGVRVIPRNRNRITDDESVVTVRQGVVVTTADPRCRLFGVRLGGFKQAGGTIRREWLLSNAKEYLIRLTSDADNNEGSLELDWYEHYERS